ncbi:MAG: hypothetical protein J5I93_25665 [Pirellulaceae bacterium]|nr:hypothetical protein [Pirellulaceae bacterium]
MTKTLHARFPCAPASFRSQSLLLPAAVFAGILLSSVAPCPAQQTLVELRETVRAADEPDEPPAESSPRKRRQRRDHSAFDDDCEDDQDDFWGALLTPFLAPAVWFGAATVTSPFWGPVRLLEDDYDRLAYFPAYPYEPEVPGSLLIDPWLSGQPRPWNLRVRGDYMDDLSGLSSWGGHVLWETTPRWGLDAELRRRREDLPAGESDQLWTGDANVLFRFAQSPHWQLRAGVGINCLADEHKQDLGINFTYGGDWYPVRPLVFSAELDLGRLGRATYFHGRFTGGIQVQRYELFCGYDYYDVGTVQIQGLVSGLRITF